MGRLALDELELRARCADTESMSARPRHLVFGVEALALVALVAFALHGVLPDTGGVAWFFDYPVYYGIVCVAVLARRRPGGLRQAQPCRVGR